MEVSGRSSLKPENEIDLLLANRVFSGQSQLKRSCNTFMSISNFQPDGKVYEYPLQSWFATAEPTVCGKFHIVTLTLSAIHFATRKCSFHPS